MPNSNLLILLASFHSHRNKSPSTGYHKKHNHIVYCTKNDAISVDFVYMRSLFKTRFVVAISWGGGKRDFSFLRPSVRVSSILLTLSSLLSSSCALLTCEWRLPCSAVRSSASASEWGDTEDAKSKVVKTTLAGTYVQCIVHGAASRSSSFLP